MEIRKIGVVGCGAMGGGIAQVAVQSGFDVRVSEVNDALLQRGLGAIRANFDRLVQRNRLKSEDADAILGRLHGTTMLADFADCDLVIEAAVESLEVKKKIFSQLDAVCPPHAILASNTSSLSILDMAMATKRPQQVAGMHFFNPVPMMRLVEIVRALTTSQETLAVCKETGAKLGKQVIVAQDTPGFIVNRLAVPFLLNAIRMVESGIATREDIDTGVNVGLNHPMGPLTLADLVGLDVILLIADAMYEVMKDPQFACPPLLRKMVTAGWLGRKTKKGFYEYQ